MFSSWGNSWLASWGASWGYGGTPPTPPEDSVLPGAYAYHRPYTKVREDEKRKELEKLARELSETERLKELAENERLELEAKKRKKKEQKERLLFLAAEERKYLDEINALRMERVRLMRMIDEEETALVLLMSLPFMN